MQNSKLGYLVHGKIPCSLTVFTCHIMDMLTIYLGTIIDLHLTCFPFFHTVSKGRIPQAYNNVSLSQDIQGL